MLDFCESYEAKRACPIFETQCSNLLSTQVTVKVVKKQVHKKFRSQCNREHRTGLLTPLTPDVQIAAVRKVKRHSGLTHHF